jgi:Protein of unknown function (DUF3025)
MPVSWAEWCAQALSPPCIPLKPLVDALSQIQWPEPLDWSGLAGRCQVNNAQGVAISFVDPSVPPPSALDFERRIYERGEVETRPATWHDAFHACAWLNFPLTKARINALHIEGGLDSTPNRRSVLRNILTLFDEGGIVVASCNGALLDLLRGFQWRELFWRERAAVQREMDFIIFGHALYERALEMHYGSTGRGILIEVERSYFDLDMSARVKLLDARLAALFGNVAQLDSTTLLQPVPIKGIPGWDAANEREDYYLDAQQFRPGRRAVAAVAAVT